MVVFFKVPLWHYIVGSGVGVVEDGLHELFATGQLMSAIHSNNGLSIPLICSGQAKASLSTAATSNLSFGINTRLSILHNAKNSLSVI